MADASQLIRFVITGASTAGLQLGSTWLFIGYLGLPVVLGSTMGVILAGLYNYMLHYYWTFSVESPHGGALVKYVLMCVVLLVTNGVVMHLGVSVFKVHYLIMQLMAALIVVIMSYSMSTFWVFAEKK